MSEDEQVNPNSYATGSVKWFNLAKGFGFITTDDVQEDVFVHQSSIKSKGYRTLQEGERVQFQIVNSEKGKIAILVTSPDGGQLKRKGRFKKGARKFTTLCYNCNNNGHRMKKCPYEKRNLRTCHKCGGDTHLIRSCPQLMKTDNS